MKHADDIVSQLQASGERITLQRRAVIDAITSGDEHQRIQTLQARMAEREIDLSETTIYRILEWLKQVGIVSQTDMGADGIVYSLIGTPRHHHLICLTCGAVITLDDSYLQGLRERLRTEFGFNARIDHMAIYGQCIDCAASRDGQNDIRRG